MFRRRVRRAAVEPDLLAPPARTARVRCFSEAVNAADLGRADTPAARTLCGDSGRRRLRGKLRTVVGRAGGRGPSGTRAARLRRRRDLGREPGARIRGQLGPPREGTAGPPLPGARVGGRTRASWTDGPSGATAHDWFPGAARESDILRSSQPPRARSRPSSRSTTPSPTGGADEHPPGADRGC